jgi:hypothetical protein
MTIPSQTSDAMLLPTPSRKTYYREYGIWKNMHRRCSGVGVLTENERRNSFERGIKVCARWNDFWTFLTDMGRTQCWHGEVSIDRINGDGDYTPDNCRWATSKTQVRNSRAVKLNPAKVKEIRRQMRAGARRENVARAFGVSPATVHDIAAGNTWRVDPLKVVEGRLVKRTPEEISIAASELFPEDER